MYIYIYIYMYMCILIFHFDQTRTPFRWDPLKKQLITIM